MTTIDVHQPVRLSERLWVKVGFASVLSASLFIAPAFADVMQWDAQGNLITRDANNGERSNTSLSGVFSFEKAETKVKNNKAVASVEPVPKPVKPSANPLRKLLQKTKKRSRAPAKSHKRLYRDLTREVALKYAGTAGVRAVGLTSFQFIDLFTALIERESAFNPRAESPKGARGLGQLMPGTAADLNVTNVWDADQNLNASARFFTSLLLKFQRIDLALAGYNAGPARVDELGRVPRIKETQDYVAWIQKRAGLDVPVMARIEPQPVETAAAQQADIQTAAADTEPQKTPSTKASAPSGTPLTGETSVWEF